MPKTLKCLPANLLLASMGAPSCDRLRALSSRSESVSRIAAAGFSEDLLLQGCHTRDMIEMSMSMLLSLEDAIDDLVHGAVA